MIKRNGNTGTTPDTTNTTENVNKYTQLGKNAFTNPTGLTPRRNQSKSKFLRKRKIGSHLKSKQSVNEAIDLPPAVANLLPKGKFKKSLKHFRPMIPEVSESLRFQYAAKFKYDPPPFSENASAKSHVLGNIPFYRTKESGFSFPVSVFTRDFLSQANNADNPLTENNNVNQDQTQIKPPQTKEPCCRTFAPTENIIETPDAEKTEPNEHNAEKIEIPEKRGEQIETLKNNTQKIEVHENKAEKTETHEHKDEKIETHENKIDKNVSQPSNSKKGIVSYLETVSKRVVSRFTSKKDTDKVEVKAIPPSGKKIPSNGDNKTNDKLASSLNNNKNENETTEIPAKNMKNMTQPYEINTKEKTLKIGEKAENESTLTITNNNESKLENTKAEQSPAVSITSQAEKKCAPQKPPPITLKQVNTRVTQKSWSVAMKTNNKRASQKSWSRSVAVKTHNKSATQKPWSVASKTNNKSATQKSYSVAMKTNNKSTTQKPWSIAVKMDNKSGTQKSGAATVKTENKSVIQRTSLLAKKNILKKGPNYETVVQKSTDDSSVNKITGDSPKVKSTVELSVEKYTGDSSVNQNTKDSSVTKSTNDSSVSKNKNTGDSPMVKSTVELSVEMHTGDLSVEKNVVKPSVERNIVKPSVEKNILKPSVQKNIVKPSVQKNIVKPSVQKNIVKPSVQKSTGKPSVDKTIDKPSVDKAIGKPSVDKAIGKPPVEKTIGKPPVEKTIGKPPVEKTIGKPSVEKTIGKPSVEKTIGKPPVEKTIGKPPVEKTIGKPPVEKTIGKPPVEKTIGKPPVEKTAEKSSVDKTTGRPPEEKNTVKPSVEKTIGKPPVETSTGKPSVETSTGKPSVETSTGKPSVEKSPVDMSAEKITVDSSAEKVGSRTDFKEKVDSEESCEHSEESNKESKTQMQNILETNSILKPDVKESKIHGEPIKQNCQDCKVEEEQGDTDQPIVIPVKKEIVQTKSNIYKRKKVLPVARKELKPNISSTNKNIANSQSENSNVLKKKSPILLIDKNSSIKLDPNSKRPHTPLYPFTPEKVRSMLMNSRNHWKEFDQAELALYEVWAVLGLESYNKYIVSNERLHSPSFKRSVFSPTRCKTPKMLSVHENLNKSDLISLKEDGRLVDSQEDLEKGNISNSGCRKLQSPEIIVLSKVADSKQSLIDSANVSMSVVKVESNNCSTKNDVELNYKSSKPFPVSSLESVSDEEKISVSDIEICERQSQEYTINTLTVCNRDYSCILSQQKDLEKLTEDQLTSKGDCKSTLFMNTQNEGLSSSEEDFSQLQISGTNAENCNYIPPCSIRSNRRMNELSQHPIAIGLGSRDEKTGRVKPCFRTDSTDSLEELANAYIDPFFRELCHMRFKIGSRGSTASSYERTTSAETENYSLDENENYDYVTCNEEYIDGDDNNDFYSTDSKKILDLSFFNPNIGLHIASFVEDDNVGTEDVFQEVKTLKPSKEVKDFQNDDDQFYHDAPNNNRLQVQPNSNYPGDCNFGESDSSLTSLDSLDVLDSSDSCCNVIHLGNSEDDFKCGLKISVKCSSKGKKSRKKNYLVLSDLCSVENCKHFKRSKISRSGRRWTSLSTAVLISEKDVFPNLESSDFLSTDSNDEIIIHKRATHTKNCLTFVPTEYKKNASVKTKRRRCISAVSHTDELPCFRRFCKWCSKKLFPK